MNSPIAPINSAELPDPGEQDLSYELATPSGDYLTQIDINHVLGNLFQALAANRISSKRAGTLGYLFANILKSQEGMHDQASFLTWTALRLLPQSPPRKIWHSPEAPAQAIAP